MLGPMDAMTMQQRRAYRPEPCQSCGAPVNVIGWTEVTRMSDVGSRWLPKRQCTDPNCVTRRGTMDAPPA